MLYQWLFSQTTGDIEAWMGNRNLQEKKQIIIVTFSDPYLYNINHISQQTVWFSLVLIVCDEWTLLLYKSVFLGSDFAKWLIVLICVIWML